MSDHHWGHEKTRLKMRDVPKMHHTKNSDPESTQRTRKRKADKYFSTKGNPDSYCRLKRCLQVPATETQSKIATKEIIHVQGQEGWRLRAVRTVHCVGGSSLFCCFVLQCRARIRFIPPHHQHTERVILRKHCPVPWNHICPKADVLLQCRWQQSSENSP